MFLLLRDAAAVRRAGGVSGNVQGLDPRGGQGGGDVRQLFALHRHVDVLLWLPAVQALVRRDVEKVSADRDLHEVLANDAAVGRVDADPAGGAEQRLAPRERLRVPARLYAVRVEERADVPRGDAQCPGHADHQVGQVLAHAGALLDDVGDRAG